MTLLMPTYRKKPVECTVEDCLAAYEEFKDHVYNNYNIEEVDNDDADISSCWRLSQGKNVTGGQYKIAYKISDGSGKQKTKYFKPKIHRMWFYCSSDCIVVAEDHDNYAVSHLCHREDCFNPEHLVLEDLASNKSRNTCPAYEQCFHLPHCIRPGLEYNPDRVVVIFNQELRQMQKYHTLTDFE